MSKSQETKTEATSPRATYQDVLDAPPNMVAEIVDGRLYTLPRPAFPHTYANSVLKDLVSPPFHLGRGGPGGWWILFKPQIHLGADILAPDMAGWRRERMPEIPTGAFTALAPDWVCEVLSPSTQKLDRSLKQHIYARESVSYLWFVDPQVKSLEAYRLCGVEWELIDKLFKNDRVSLPPFEAISFNLGDLWLPPTLHKGTPMTVQSDQLTA